MTTLITAAKETSQYTEFRNVQSFLLMTSQISGPCCDSDIKPDQCNVSVKSKLQHAQSPGHLTFLKIIVQIPPYLGQNTVQMPHTRVHSGDQMPPPRGHFKGTKMTERRWKCFQLSNKIFINITKTEKHC